MGETWGPGGQKRAVEDVTTPSHPPLPLSVPVCHLGPSQAGHGLLQVLSKVQDILHCPLPLGLWVWEGEGKHGVSGGLPARTLGVQEAESD